MTKRPGRIFARVLIGAGAVVLVLLVGAFLALSVVDWNQHVAFAAGEVKRATGRELKVGNVEVGALPPRVIVEEVSLSNAPWGSRPELVRAKRVAVRFAFLPLFVGKLKLKLDVLEPDVFLETNENGLGNWVIAGSGAAAKPDPRSESKALPVDFDSARLAKGIVQYRSGKTKRVRKMAFDEASIRPAGLAGRRVVVAANVDGVPVSLDGTTDDLIVETLSVGKPLGIKLELKVASATLAAAGRVGFPASGADLDLKVRADVPQSRELAKLLGDRVPALPPLKLEGELKSAKRVHAIDNLRLAMGRSSASGTVRTDLSGPRPRVSANVVAPTIDLLELREPGIAGGQAAAGRPSGRVFPSDPLPLATLGELDVDVDLKIERLVLPPTLLLESVRGKVVLAGGKLETRSLAMHMGGGDVKLDGALDARGAQQAKLSARVAGREIELGKMLAALGKEGALTGGRTEVDAELRAAGGSVAALAANLNGHLKVVMGPARTETRVIDRAGLDVVTQVLNAVNPMRKTQDYTQIQCAVINVPVRNGVVTVDRTIAGETNQVGIAMAGTVNLGDETIDLSIRPQQKEGVSLSVGGLANLVKLEGTLADPKVGIDVAGAAGAAAQIGIGVVTGGLSLLAKGLFDKATMKAPCQTALQAGQAPASATGGAAPPQSGSGGGIGGLLDRLLK